MQVNLFFCICWKIITMPKQKNPQKGSWKKQLDFASYPFGSPPSKSPWKSPWKSPQQMGQWSQIVPTNCQSDIFVRFLVTSTRQPSLSSLFFPFSCSVFFFSFLLDSHHCHHYFVHFLVLFFLYFFRYRTNLLHFGV